MLSGVETTAVRPKPAQNTSGRWPSFVGEEVFFFFWFQSVSFLVATLRRLAPRRVLCSESFRVLRWLRARCVRLVTPLLCVESFAPFVVSVGEKAKHVRWFLADVQNQPSCWLEDPWKRKEMQPW